MFKPVAVGDLRFDPENPRLPENLDGDDDQAVLDWMLSDAGLIELMGSIAVKGFFPAEPLLVMPAEPGDGYLVLEGNRRLAAVLLLNEPERAPKRRSAVQSMAELAADVRPIEALPCAIFERRSDVLDYLGFRHITGIKQWEPAAKARYLDTLYGEHLPNEGTEVYRHIARLIGSRSDYVMRLLGALRLYELISEDDELGIEDLSFSLLTLALNYTAICRYLGLEVLTQENFQQVDRTKLRKLANWLFREHPDIGRTQLGESRNMKLLAAAVAHGEGRAALERGETAEEAAAATFDVDELFLRALRTARDRLVSSQALLHRATYTPEAETTLVELEDLVDQIRVLLRRKERTARNTGV